MGTITGPIAGPNVGPIAGPVTFVQPVPFVEPVPFVQPVPFVEPINEKIEPNVTASAEPIIKPSSPFVCDLTQYTSKTMAGNLDGCPWLPRGYEYDSDILGGLHTEIEYFNRYMLPTSTEYALRVRVVERIEALILQVWPFAYVEVTGSQKYGLYLPSSEILLAVQNCPNRNRLLDAKALENKISASGVAEPNTVEIASYGTSDTPVIHLIDRVSKIKVEIVICVNVGNILRKTELIKANLHKYPKLSKLILVLKQFLLQYNLNGTNLSISTYELITMCIRFLQSLSERVDDTQVNSGFLLVGFFNWYARIFDFKQNCIENDGRFLPQEEKKRDISVEYMAKQRCSADSLKLSGNTTRPIYNIEFLKCAFQYAHNLVSSNAPLNDANDCTRSSLLSRIIRISDEVIEYRKWIHSNFKHIFSNRNI